MVCWTTVRVTVSLGDRIDKKLLVQALEGLGYSVVTMGDGLRFRDDSVFQGIVGAWVGGKLSINSKSDAEAARVTNQVKQAYSTACVKAAAKSFGWAAVEEASKDGARVFSVSGQGGDE